MVFLQISEMVVPADVDTNDIAAVKIPLLHVINSLLHYLDRAQTFVK